MDGVLTRKVGAAQAQLTAGLVAYALGVSPAAILAPTRGAPGAANARQLVIYLLNTTFGMSLERIGRTLARDRSAVAHGVRVIEDRRADDGFDAWLAQLEACLRAAPAPASPEGVR